jgi:pimeloyl-ACP methyl ester carboxylesterase
MARETFVPPLTSANVRAPVAHRLVDLPGVRVHVALAGDEAAPPVVLLHGWPQHWWCFRAVIPALARSHRVIAPDLRGHGWSEAPSSGYAMEQLASDLLALLDALAVERAGLVGHDWGAYAGTLACLRAPRRFSGLLALSIVPPTGDPPPRAALEARRLAYQLVLAAPVAGPALLRASPALVARAIASGARRREHLDDATCRAYGRVLQEPARARASSLLYRTFLTRELPAVAAGRHRDARLHVPTLLLSGADDPAVRPVMLRNAAARADALRVHVVEGCGHFLPEERPDLVVAGARELFAAGSSTI